MPSALPLPLGFPSSSSSPLPPFTFLLPTLLAIFHSAFGHRYGLTPHNVHIFPSPRGDNRSVAKCNPDGIIPSDQLLFICDPDAILEGKEKMRLNGKLVELAESIGREKTRMGNEEEAEECGWGLHLGIALVNRPFAAIHSTVRFGQKKDTVEWFLRRKWSLDSQRECQRTAQLVLVAQKCGRGEPCLSASMDSSLALALPKLEMDALIGQQERLLHRGHFGRALSNIVVGIRRLALHRIRLLNGANSLDRPLPASPPPPFPLLILAFLLTLAIWELVKLSLQPKLKKWWKMRKGGAKENGGGAIGQAEKAREGEARQLLPEEVPKARLYQQRHLPDSSPPNESKKEEQIEMAEKQVGRTSSGNGGKMATRPVDETAAGRFKSVKQRKSRPSPKAFSPPPPPPPVSLQNHNAEEQKQC